MGLLNLLSRISFRILVINSNIYINYFRRKGVTIGEGTRFFGRNIRIDLQRPLLVEIGRNCVLTDGVTLLAHSYDWTVLRDKYGEMLGSSKKVILEDNVFVGGSAIILKGVRIGRNTIIGAGSVVTHDIPPNSVAAGNPCKVLMSIDEYREKRKRLYIQESKAMALDFYRKTGRVPKKEYFFEEFCLFLRKNDDWGKLPVKKQLGSAFERFMKSEPLYNSFEEFLIEAGIPKDKIEKRKKLRASEINQTTTY